MKTRVILMLLLICLVCFVAGCGSKSDKTYNTGDRDVFTIETKIQGGGSIEVVSSAKGGENVRVIIKPRKGFNLRIFKVNKVDKLAEVENNCYIIEDINENIIISAEFGGDAVATYATKEPKIDGKIEAIWEKVEKLYTNGHRIEIPSSTKFQNHGYVSIMWDENNLYFLGVVYDEDITTLDRINFWISEAITTRGNSYSTKPSDGMYYSIVTPFGKQETYKNSIDFSIVNGYECETQRFSEGGKGYIVEMKIPKQSDVAYKEGHMVGFDVSIDTYYTGETSRGKYKGGILGEDDFELYCYWKGAGKYWEDPAALGAIELVR